MSDFRPKYGPYDQNGGAGVMANRYASAGPAGEDAAHQTHQAITGLKVMVAMCLSEPDQSTTRCRAITTSPPLGVRPRSAAGGPTLIQATN